MTDPVSEVHDPADDYQVTDVPGDRDDVDVPLADGKDTQDGKGDEEPPASDFQGYADPTADVEDQN